MACAKRDARVRMACMKLEHRSNTSGQSMGFYRQSGALVAVRLPPSQMPGYAGQNPNASRDIGTSKAFGQPFVRWTIPRTPDATAGPTGRGADGWTLSDGFGPIGRETKHKFGPASAKVNAAYDESDRMLEALARQRVLNGPDTFQRNGAPWHEGKRAPFDFVPNEGLVEECHIHESGRYKQFPKPAAKKPNPRFILRRPKGLRDKGYAPCAPVDRTQPGLATYSIFKLPTYNDMMTRRAAVTIL